MNVKKYNEKLSFVSIISRRFKVKQTIYSSMDILHSIIADGISLDEIDINVVSDYCARANKSEILSTDLSELENKSKKDFYFLTCCRCKDSFPESAFRIITKGKRQRRNYSCIFCDRKYWSKYAKNYISKNPNFKEHMREYKAKWTREKRKNPEVRKNHNLYMRQWSKNKRQTDPLYRERQSLKRKAYYIKKKTEKLKK